MDAISKNDVWQISLHGAFDTREEGVTNKRQQLLSLLSNREYLKHETFGLIMPMSCPNVPTDILNPINTWENKAKYKKEAEKLAELFHQNFNSIRSSIKSESNISKADLQNILLGSPNKI